MLTMRKTAVALLLVVLVGASGFAHKPVSIGGVFDGPDAAAEVTNVDVSQVVYAALTAEHPELWIRFEITEPIELFVSLGIPVLDRLTDYRPIIAVLGPGMPAVEADVAIPAGLGGIDFDSRTVGEPRFFHEPFTGTDSWILIEETVPLVEPGEYYVVARSPADGFGKLWVAVGTKERFGLQDVLRLPTIAREVRAFHEVAADPDPDVWGRILFLAAAALAIVLLAR